MSAHQLMKATRDVRGFVTARRLLRWLLRRLRWRLLLLRHRRSYFARYSAREARPGTVRAAPPEAVLPPRTVAAEALQATLGRGDAAGASGFDVTCCNPVGWVRNVEHRVVKLRGRRLPATPADLAGEARWRCIRRCHHVEDDAAGHTGLQSRAELLVALAAMGVPVRLGDGGSGLAGLLGTELHRLVQSEPRGLGAGARERFSVALRRAALREHGMLPDGRPVRDAAPTVSVLLATRRPEWLGDAVASVARQNYPRLELVLGLHGDGFDPGVVATATADCPVPVNVIRTASDDTLGATLNAAVRVAGGTLLTKMDDDDVYGPDHVWDLVLARIYSGAELVGKGLETVYLTGCDRTLQRSLGAGETLDTRRHRPELGGMTLLLARDDLAGVGRWRDLRRGVDRALVDDVLAAGGRIYRTHAQGLVYVRHGAGHTWGLRESRFLADADTVHSGWCPELASVEQPRPLSRWGSSPGAHRSERRG